MFKHDRRWARQLTRRERKFKNEVTRLAAKNTLLKRLPCVRVLREIMEVNHRPQRVRAGPTAIWPGLN